MLTSADATLDYLAENHFSRRLLLIGTPSLEAQFAAAGYEVRADAPQAVVLGFDTTLTYEKLVLLCDAVRAGLPYIATPVSYTHLLCSSAPRQKQVSAWSLMTPQACRCE